MHEVALSSQLARMVSRAVAGRSVVVRVVRVRVGALRQVVPSSLYFAWEFTVAGTPLEGAELDCEEIPVTLGCACGVELVVDELDLDLNVKCPKCGCSMSIVKGDEFTVVDVEVDYTGGSSIERNY